MTSLTCEEESVPGRMSLGDMSSFPSALESNGGYQFTHVQENCIHQNTL